MNASSHVLGVRKRWYCAVVDGVLFTLPVGHWRIAIFGADPPSFKRKCRGDFCDNASSHLSWPRIIKGSTCCRRLTTSAKPLLAWESGEMVQI